MEKLNLLNFISVLIAFISIVISYIVHRRTKKLEKWSMIDEYAQLIPERSIFWDNLRIAFDKFKNESEFNREDLMTFIESIRIPNNILDCSNIKFFELKEANYDQKQMELFCNLIYPIKAKNTEELKELSILPHKYSIDFFKARSLLAAFWDKWSSRKKKKWIKKNFETEKYLILILTWLDVSHRKWTKEDDRGKQKMYKLADSYF